MLTPGTIAGIVFLPLGVIALIVAALLVWRGFRDRKDGGYYADGFGWFLSAGLVALFAIPAIAAPLIGFGIVGYSADYLTMKPVRGTVEQVASRQIASGKAMETRYVAVIDGQPYGIDDTRAALIKPGDTISLMCTREFVYGSQNNGYACNWG